MSFAAPSSRSPFEAANAWLASLHPRGIRLGLDGVRMALERLGSPHLRLPAVTIAGTNGKGSTAAFLASMAHMAGYRVGLYTSPHLVHVTERIRLGSLPILPDDFAEQAFLVRAAMQGTHSRPELPLTYFEAMTVMAIHYFHQREVDLAILEVGLGGRLDATAVVPPLVSVITPIGLDHQEYLGDTLEAICTEKAGIIQEGATVVTNVAPELFRAVIGPKAYSLRCPIRRAEVDFLHAFLPEGFRYRGWIGRLGPVRLGLRGTHQGDNAALACAAAESLAPHGFCMKPMHMAEGLARARHPGRLELRDPQIDPSGRSWPLTVLDGAHNPLGAQTLATELDAFLTESPRVLLFAAKADKDVRGILTHLAPKVDAIIVTTAPLLSDAAEVAPHARALCPNVLVEPDLERAVETARRLTGASGSLLVSGSLYLLGAVIPLLPTPTPFP